MSEQNIPPAMSPGLKPNRFRLTLFWKIIIWFWLTIVILITTFLFVGYVNSDKIHYRPLPPPIAHELEMISRQTMQMIHRQRPDHDPEERMGRRRMHDIFLLDQSGDDLLSHPVPELLSELHNRSRREQQPLTAFRHKEAYFGGMPLEIDGKTYWLYSAQKMRMFDGHLFENFFQDVASVLLIATFIISFPVSFILSWLITRPIHQLQQATRDLKTDLNNREQLIALTQRSDEFAELAQDVNSTANHLNTLLQSQKQLVSDVSHELRSPLTRLKIALGILENRLGDQQADSISRLKLESDRMNNMLESLLSLSRVEAQQINAERETFDFAELIRNVVKDGQYEAAQSSIEIETRLPDHCTFLGVKEALISGIDNILRNAIRYTGENGKIICELNCNAKQIILQIRDTGPGVAADQLARLFDPFYRPERDRNRNTGGVGLGLSIAKQAFAINGGTISAMNVEPHGLQVEVVFGS